MHVQINAHSHLASMLLGSSETVPVTSGKLVLGQWQSVSSEHMLGHWFCAVQSVGSQCMLGAIAPAVSDLLVLCMR